MSNKVEAALGGAQPNTYTDSSGDEYVATNYGDVIELVRFWGEEEADKPIALRFWAKDATKIIALIAEAAK